MSNVLVHICENDKNGKRSGFVHRFNFCLAKDLSCFLELEAKGFTGVEIKEFGNSVLRIYGMEFKFANYGNWVGNIMWNEYNMPAPYALGLINLLCSKGEFQCSNAWSTIYRKWNKQEQIVAFDIGINDKTVVQEVIDPNQLDLFTKPAFCSNVNYGGERYRCKQPCGKNGQCEATE